MKYIFLKRESGFSLIELMIVVAIIGILAGIAYPSYTEFVTKSKRGDAKAALLDAQLQQEKYRTNNTTYGTATQAGIEAVSTDGYYTIAVSGNTGTAYLVTAAPKSPHADSTCGTFAVNQDGKITDNTSYADADCW